MPSPMIGASCCDEWRQQIQEVVRKGAEVVVREAIAQALSQTDLHSFRGAIVGLQRVATLERKLSGIGRLVGYPK